MADKLKKYFTPNELMQKFISKYKLVFWGWIEQDVADFKVYVFTVQEMKFALENNLTFDEMVEKSDNIDMGKPLL